jgi:hypothetical protein
MTKIVKRIGDLNRAGEGNVTATVITLQWQAGNWQATRRAGVEVAALAADGTTKKFLQDIKPRALKRTQSPLATSHQASRACAGGLALGQSDVGHADPGHDLGVLEKSQWPAASTAGQESCTPRNPIWQESARDQIRQ